MRLKIAGTSQLVDLVNDGYTQLTGSNLNVESTNTNTFTIVEDDPLSATVSCERMVGYYRDNWRIKIETSSRMSADTKSFFHVTNVLDAFEGNTRIFTKSWSSSIPVIWCKE